jgi:hypothetical protein
LDLHDYLTSKLSSTDFSLSSLLGYLCFQLDLLRPGVKPDDRYRLRANKELLTSVMQDFGKAKPNYPLHKMLDTLHFLDDTQIIPELALRNHLKKVYQYADEAKIRLFVTLCDVNGDSKIDVKEVCSIIADVDQGQTTVEKTAANIA